MARRRPGESWICEREVAGVVASPCEKAERRRKKGRKSSFAPAGQPFFITSLVLSPLLAGRDVQKSLSPGRWAVDKVNHGLIYDVELPLPHTSAGRSVFGSFVDCHLDRHVSCIGCFNSCSIHVTVQPAFRNCFLKKEGSLPLIYSIPYVSPILFFLNKYRRATTFPRRFSSRWFSPNFQTTTKEDHPSWWRLSSSFFYILV